MSVPKLAAPRYFIVNPGSEADDDDDDDDDDFESESDEDEEVVGHGDDNNSDNDFDEDEDQQEMEKQLEMRLLRLQRAPRVLAAQSRAFPEPSLGLRDWIANNNMWQVKRAREILRLPDTKETTRMLERRVREYRDSREASFTLLQYLCTGVGDHPEHRAWWRCMRHCIFHVLAEQQNAASARPRSCQVGLPDVEPLDSPYFVYDLCVAHIQHDAQFRDINESDVEKMVKMKPADRVAAFFHDPSVQNFKLLVYVSFWWYAGDPEKTIGNCLAIINTVPEFLLHERYNWPPRLFEKYGLKLCDTPKVFLRQLAALCYRVDEHDELENLDFLYSFACEKKAMENIVALGNEAYVSLTDLT